MATSKKFSELPAASSVGNGDLFAIAHEDALAETGYVSQKLTAAQAGQKVNGDTEYPTSLPSFPANGQNPFAALEKLNQDIIDLYPVNSASGSIATFSTLLALPLVECKAEITAQQASGTPTPSSPLPISGFSSVKFVQTGKNLFDKNNLIDGKTISSDGSIIDGNYAKLTDYIPINGQCTFSAVHIAGTAALRLGLYDENKNFISRAVSTVGAVGSLTTLTINNSNVKFVRANLFTTGENVNTAQVEQGTTATSYEAYQENTFTISLGQIVFGGTIDCKSGKATITHGRSILDGSDENWGLASDGTVNRRFVLYGLPALKNGSTSIANYLVYATGTSHDFGTYGIGKSEQYGYYIVLHDKSSNFANTDALKSYLAEHNLELVYELATPVEIDITANNFTTIAGEQNIFSDCGEVSISFKQTVQEYIDAKIAETQALIL